MQDMEKDGVWQGYKDDWKGTTIGGGKDDLEIWSVWSKSFVEDISKSRDVESVIALGSVLAISLRDTEHAGKLW